MSRSHTRSLFVDVAPGVWLGQFPYATGPKKLLQWANEEHTKIDLATSKFVVVGGTKRNLGGQTRWLNLQSRWSTLTGLELKEIYDQGVKDKSIRSIRGISRIAGTTQGAGSEPAILVQLDKSKAGLALAEKYHCNYSVTNLVGRNEKVAVTHGPSFMMSVDVERLITGELVHPDLERDTEIPGRNGGMDMDNPTFQQLVAFFDATGDLMPRSSQQQFNSELAAQVVGMPQRRQNGYGPANYAPQNNGYQQVQNWAQRQATQSLVDEPEF